ncbi:MAG: hypothetical protein E7511_06230 [Ruminococcus sp.]|nr:hypothetical protein [Ruminococcus sp.]
MDERNEFDGMPMNQGGIDNNPFDDSSPFDEISTNPEQNDIPDPAAHPSTYQSSFVSLTKPTPSVTPAPFVPDLQPVPQPPSSAPMPDPVPQLMPSVSAPDPGTHTTASPMPSIPEVQPIPKPSPKPSAEPFGEATSGEYIFAEDPHAAPKNRGAQPRESYEMPDVSAKNDTYDYGKPYSQQNTEQNPYSQEFSSGAMNSGPVVSPELEKEAANIFVYGMLSIIISIVIGGCCCTIPGLILGIVALVRAKKLKPMMNQLSPEAQRRVHTGRVLSIVGIVLGIMSTAAGALIGGVSMLETMLAEMDSYY